MVSLRFVVVTGAVVAMRALGTADLATPGDGTRAGASAAPSAWDVDSVGLDDSVCLLQSARVARHSSSIAKPWTKHASVNCFQGNGGVPLGRPLSSRTIEACENACVQNENCTALVAQSDTQTSPCWLLASVDLGKCIDPYNGFDTYTLDGPTPAPTTPAPTPTSTKSWTKHASVNCFQGNCGVPLGGPLSSRTIEACETACVQNANCTALVVQSDTQTSPCWLLASVDLGKCVDPYNGFDTYTLDGPTPAPTTPAPTPTPAPTTPAPTPAPTTPAPTPTSTKSWTKHASVNCFQGNGGVPLGPPLSSRTIEACETACVQNASCTALVAQSDTQTSPCYLLASVDLGKCIDPYNGFDTYTLDGPTPAPTTPAPTPPLTCGLGYTNVDPCPAGSNKGTPQTDWIPTAEKTCAGPCNGYATLQWTAVDGAANDAIKRRNNGSLISPSNNIPRDIDSLRCWFLPEFSWGMQNPGPAPPFNPQPEVAYLDDAGNGLGGGLPGPDSTVACCCQEECTMEMIELRHWILEPPSCGVDISYNTNGNNGRVLLTRTSNRHGQLLNTKHESCMCGDRMPEQQMPFYYYVVQGPAYSTASSDTLLWWLNSLRTAYSNLFDIWSQRPPCSGECVIMGGASDAWVSYDKSTTRSILFQLRAFAAFDPGALPNACGTQGVMLRFGGMTLNESNVVTCEGVDKWGQTGAACTTLTVMPDNFYDMVTLADDAEFFSQAGAPSEIRLETDRAVATISSSKGVEVRAKKNECRVPQPTLNFPWRCTEQGGISDNATCLELLPAN